MAQRYVNTASSAGGDGTTNATSGANRAYVSLTEWEAARQGILAEIETVDCEGGASNETLTINGSTSTASFYMRVRAASGQEAQTPFSTSRFRVAPTNGNCIVVSDPHAIVERIQGDIVDTGSNRAGVYVTETSVLVAGCIVRASNSNQNTCFGTNTGGGSSVVFVNCVAIGNAQVGSQGFAVSGGDLTYFYSCTGVRNGINFDTSASASGGMAKNCLGHDSPTADFSGTWASGSCNNASEDATAPGTSSRTTQTFTFVDDAGRDYHLTSGDAGARTFGVNLSADAIYPFSVDFDANARVAPWDIGAFQTASLPPVPPPLDYSAFPKHKIAQRALGVS